MRRWQAGSARLASLALAIALTSGCASQMAGQNRMTALPVANTAEEAERAMGISDRAAYKSVKDLPSRPLEDIHSLSGMQSRSSEAVVQAVAQLGTPYRWGGSSAENGFDCSGLTQYAYRAAELPLPRTSYQQYRATRRVARDELRPGDLVFFRLSGSRIDHVGIYVSENRFIHAPSSGKTVTFSRLDKGFWARRYVGGGRAPDANELQLAEN